MHFTPAPITNNRSNPQTRHPRPHHHPDPRARLHAMPATNAAVTAVFIIAVATLVAIFLVNGQILLYLNRLGITTTTDPSFYVQLAASQSLFRIPSSLILGWCSASFGPTRILTALQLVASVGVAIMIATRPSRPALFVGYMLFCEAFTSRQFRISILADLVTPANRTPIILMHTAMRHVAYILGPAVWLLIQNWRDSATLRGYVVDRFTLSHASALIMFLLTSLLIQVLIRPRAPDDHDRAQLPESTNSESTPLRAPAPMPVTAARPALPFALILALRSSCIIVTAVTDVSFQPVLVDIFGAGDAELGRLYVLAAVLGMAISCVQSWVSHLYSDFTVILVGVALIIVGQLMMMPVFARVQKWQVVVGYILSSRAVVLPSAVLSLFTKRTSSQAQKEKGLAVCNSTGSVVKAGVRLLLAHHILILFGNRLYLLVSLPLLISTAWFVISWQRCKGTP